VLDSVRYLLADLRHWLGRHRLAAAATVVALAAAAVAAFLLAGTGGDDQQPAPAPEVVVREVSAPEQPEEVGFPAFATKNTTRVAGPDPVANAAGVALAVYPSTGGVPGPDAVTLVDEADWPAGIAASSLVAAPVGAPILITESGDVPELTEGAIRSLGPAGSSRTEGAELFALGAAAAPDDYETLEVEGTNAAELAAEVERLRARLAGRPEHILIASSDEPEYAMPAASWAARSGDPVLFVQRDSVPAVTRKTLERREGTPVYVLGPSSVIPAKLLDEIERVAPTAERIGAEGPVENAIEFARFASGSFGWNINDPGHGLVIASTAEALDAAAAAPLSASGTWGPLLVTDQPAAVPATLRGYLLDLKPGYEDDPTRAVYNHVWLIGDTAAISVGFQAQVDEIVEVAPVTSGSGATTVVPGPGTVESAPDDPQPDKADKSDQEPKR
jgi:hypothetical protein